MKVKDILQNELLFNKAVTICNMVFCLILLFIYKLSLLFLMSALILIIFAESSKTDLKYRIIPNKYIIIGLLIGIAEQFTFTILHQALYNYILAPIVGFFLIPSVLVGISLLYERFKKIEGIGFGDIKAFAILGLFLGFEYQLIFFTLTTIFSAIPSTIMAIRKKSINITVPLAPFMFFSLFITLVIAGVSVIH